MGRTNHAFLSELDRDELRDIALAFEGGGNHDTAAWLRELAGRPPVSYDMDFVHVVEVPGREDPIYTFAERGRAERFEAVVRPAGAEPGAFLSEQVVYTGPAAESQIASERGDVLEGMGWEEFGEEVREGLCADALLARVRPTLDVQRPDSEERELLDLLRRWAEEDAQACTGAVVDGKVQHDGPTCPVHEGDATTLARCDNCERHWALDQLAQPPGLSERVDPGGEAPAGECPACGALAYYVQGGQS